MDNYILIYELYLPTVAEDDNNKNDRFLEDKKELFFLYFCISRA